MELKEKKKKLKKGGKNKKVKRKYLKLDIARIVNEKTTYIYTIRVPQIHGSKPPPLLPPDVDVIVGPGPALFFFSSS